MLHISAKKEDTHVVNLQPRNTFYKHNVARGLLVLITDNN